MAFDPSKLDIRSRTIRVHELLEREHRQFFASPAEYAVQVPQRRDSVWQSRYIETLVLRIQTPLMWIVELPGRFDILADGAARVHALASFYHGSLRLAGMEFAPQLEGKLRSEIPGGLELRLLETELQYNEVRLSTPPDAAARILNRSLERALPVHVIEDAIIKASNAGGSQE